MANILAVVAFVVGVVSTASGLVVCTAVRFDTTTGAEVARLPARGVQEGRIYFNPSGTRLIAVANQAGLSVVDVPAGRLLAMPDPGFESVESLAFSPDGLTRAVGRTGRQFAVFDVEV
jgi:hypothetical protein